jgi:hypothetical protein
VQRQRQAKKNNRELLMSLWIVGMNQYATNSSHNRTIDAQQAQRLLNFLKSVCRKRDGDRDELILAQRSHPIDRWQLLFL